MTIRPHDLVRLRHTPDRLGVVMVVADGLALVDFDDAKLDVCAWLPVDILELVPGQFEKLAA